MPKLLLVEDDSRLVKPLARTLQAEGYDVSFTGRGEEAVRMARTEHPHVILLDVTLDRRSFDGIEVCRQLRRQHVDSAIIMLTVSNSEMDKVVGLEAGADDYLTKPFSLAELLARIRAHLRRQQLPDTLHFGDIQVDFKGRRLHREGKPVDLTNAEFEILRLLIQNCGRAVSRDRIVRDVLNCKEGVGLRRVDTHILNLRKKLEDDPSNPIHIRGVHGDGYLFIA